MGFVTTFCSLTMAGSGETVTQDTGERRLVVDCKEKPVAFVGHVKITFIPTGVIVSSGWMNRLNTVPLAEFPPD